MSNRHRPCGQIALAMPIGALTSASALPCSTCSSTKAIDRRVGRAMDRGRVKIRMLHGFVLWCVDVAQGSGSFRYRRHLPSAATQARDAKRGALLRGENRHTDGFCRATALARRRSIAASADTTPSGPS